MTNLKSKILIIRSWLKNPFKMNNLFYPQIIKCSQQPKCSTLAAIIYWQSKNAELEAMYCIDSYAYYTKHITSYQPAFCATTNTKLQYKKRLAINNLLLSTYCIFLFFLVMTLSLRPPVDFSWLDVITTKVSETEDNDICSLFFATGQFWQIRSI